MFFLADLVCSINVEALNSVLQILVIMDKLEFSDEDK